MRKLKITVVREVSETWEYIIDADGLEISEFGKASPAEFSNAYITINDVINGIEHEDLDRHISEKLVESDIREESIEEWEEIKGGELK